ncbi:two-component system sensor histidine kinase PhoR [Idiomarina tyrosinivorans]|uniref:histidine kinase n=1 Tax=Idiomarina tyrosinivorans TaxID=1445662 RepID=A0A432ZSA3_9GAMM|nr:phosphate regulon sensor histidine kinase PhoR [Idiomarina tyrosinivorans]RUO80790.1 two-component system sensor histidine kinase PhoR [Idiomarina tyrosinivorans]
MDNHYSVPFILRGLLLFLAPFLLIGWLADAFWMWLAIGLIVVVSWHYLYQLRLIHWLWRSRNLLPPSASGSWSYIYDGIYRTQRRSQQRRRALARILRRFREASEALPDAAFVFRRDGALLWSNKLAQFYFGLRWPGDAGLRISSLIRHPDFLAYLNRGDFSEALNMPSPMRESLELELRIMPYSEDQFLLIARDVTQLRQLENMRRDFVANVSHELKTPLTVLQGYLEMMESPADVPDALLAKAVKDMDGQTTRMGKLIDQLLVLSRIESQAGDIFDHKVGMPRLLKALENDAITLNSERNHELVFDFENVDMYGREDEMRSVIMNLVSNAIYYTPAGGTIRISWKPVLGGAMEFCVEDTGPGIAQEHIPRLTERFYRVDRDRNSKRGGTGLGLSIVKHALEHHNSHLQINSLPGKGSRFSFRISAEQLVDDN